MTEETKVVENPSPDEAPEPLVFTDACVAKVKELLAEEDDPNMPLRVFVQGGGCQGFQYGFQFEEKPAEDDAVIAADALDRLGKFNETGQGPVGKRIFQYSLV